MFIRKLIKYIFFLSVILFIVGAATAYFYGVIPTSIGIHSKIYTKSNIAMGGYDIVNYFLGKSAVKGNTRFSIKQNEHGWLFNSDRTLKMFKAKPQKYIPQFGGYCVYTISKGYTYPPDPKVWRLHKGRIYFFKDEETKKLAIEDWASVIENAKLHWIE